jgi:hypothetical protein
MPGGLPSEGCRKRPPQAQMTIACLVCVAGFGMWGKISQHQVPFHLGAGAPDKSLVCPESCHLPTAESPVVATARRPRDTPSLPRRRLQAGRRTNGRRRHALLSAPARTGEGLSQATPTDVGSVSLVQEFRPTDPAYEQRASEARRGAIYVALEPRDCSKRPSDRLRVVLLSLLTQAASNRPIS